MGYGGTKTEMQRLISDAANLSDTVDAQSLSFANIVEAIHVVQTEMGITGTTAFEAGRTISGSVNSMKAAWSNLITGIADDNADFGALIDDFVTTIVGDGTQNNLGVLGNILPRIETALEGAIKLIEGLFPKIVELLPRLFESVLPRIIGGAINIIQAFISAISDNKELLIDSGLNAIVSFVMGLLEMLPEIIKTGLELIVSLANGISKALPELIPAVVDIILEIVDVLTDPKMLTNLLEAALTIILELAYGLMEAIPNLVEAVSTIIINIADFLCDPENLAMILKAALEVIIALATGLINAIPTLLLHLPKLWGSIIDNFKNVDWGQLGQDFVDGLLEGLKKAWDSITSWCSKAWADLKALFDFSKETQEEVENAKKAREVYDELNSVQNQPFAEPDPFAPVGPVDDGSTPFQNERSGDINITQNINGANMTPSEAMAEAKYQQELAILS